MDDDTAALATYLVYLGLADDKPGYGHATGNQVAEASMKWVHEHYHLTPKSPVAVQPGSVQRSDYSPFTP